MHHAEYRLVKMGIIVSYCLPQDVSDPKAVKKLCSAEKAGWCLGRKEKGRRHVSTRCHVILDARGSLAWPVSGVKKLMFVAHYGAMKPETQQDRGSRPPPR